MLIFLAGLQGVPQSLLDAAEIDGAGRWAKFRHVVLPMTSPTLLKSGPPEFPGLMAASV